MQNRFSSACKFSTDISQLLFPRLIVGHYLSATVLAHPLPSTCPESNPARSPSSFRATGVLSDSLLNPNLRLGFLAPQPLALGSSHLSHLLDCECFILVDITVYSLKFALFSLNSCLGRQSDTTLSGGNV